jgi:hypothetical protein
VSSVWQDPSDAGLTVKYIGLRAHGSPSSGKRFALNLTSKKRAKLMLDFFFLTF